MSAVEAPPLRIAFTVYGQAAPAGSKRHVGNGRIVDSSKRSAPWKNLVAEYAAREMAERVAEDVGVDVAILGGPLAVKMTFYVPRPKGHYRTSAQGLVHHTERARQVLNATVSESLLRPSAPVWPTTRPDVLKLARAVEDACTGIIWRDDAQIVDEQLVKRYGEPARVEIVVMAA